MSLDDLGRTYHGGAPDIHTIQFPPGVDGTVRTSVDRDGCQRVEVRSPEGPRVKYASLQYLPEAFETVSDIVAGVTRTVNDWLATLESDESWGLSVRVLPSNPEYFSVTYTWPKVGRKRRRSQLAAPGTRRKRGGGHRSHSLKRGSP